MPEPFDPQGIVAEYSRTLIRVKAKQIVRRLPGGQVLDQLDAYEIAPYLWADSTRPTTNKTRFILRGQLRPDRFDFESKAPIPGDAAEYLAACPNGDALLIQDYGKGVCTASLYDHCCRRPRPQACPFSWIQPAVGTGGTTRAAP
jgi:bifunctional ADP-heptose synthase (sugar kinase/adenylyltransferase)